MLCEPNLTLLTTWKKYDIEVKEYQKKFKLRGN